MRYQLKCDQLEILLSKTEGQYTSILNDKKNIVQFLKSELESKSDQVIEMSNELYAVSNTNQAIKNQYQNDIEIMKKDYEIKIENFTNEIQKLSKLNSS